MAAYAVEAYPRVRKALRQLDPKARASVLAKMRELTADPRPMGAESLRGYPPWLRVRAGDYRIIYAVDDQARVVTGARKRRDDGHQSDGLSGEMTGDGPHPGASAKAAPCRAEALRARRADAWRPSPLP